MAGSLNDKLFRTISEDTVSDPGGRTWVSGTVTANFSPAASQTVTFNQPVDVAVLDSATGTETNVGDFTNKALRVNVVAGGAGGGTAQLAVRNTADSAWVNVGYGGANLLVPIQGTVTANAGTGTYTTSPNTPLVVSQGSAWNIGITAGQSVTANAGIGTWTVSDNTPLLVSQGPGGSPWTTSPNTPLLVSQGVAGPAWTTSPNTPLVVSQGAGRAAAAWSVSNNTPIAVTPGGGVFPVSPNTPLAVTPGGGAFTVSANTPLLVSQGISGPAWTVSLNTPILVSQGVVGPAWTVSTNTPILVNLPLTSIGSAVNKTVVWKTASLNSTATTNDQVIQTYTVTVGKTLFLEWVSLQARLSALSATASLLGTASWETPSGTKVFQQVFVNPTTSAVENPAVLTFGEPLPIAASTVLRSVVTPSSPNSMIWLSNFGGYER